MLAFAADFEASLMPVSGNYDLKRIATYSFTIFTELINYCLWLGCERLCYQTQGRTHGMMPMSEKGLCLTYQHQSQ